MGTTLVLSDWMDAQQHIGTVKVLSSAKELTALQDTQVQSALEILRAPQFWIIVLRATPGGVRILRGGIKSMNQKNLDKRKRRLWTIVNSVHVNQITVFVIGFVI